MSEVSALEALLVPRVKKDEHGDRLLDRRDYEETLPEDLDMGTIKRVEHHNALYRAASTRALGGVAMEDLLADPKKDKVNTRAEYGTQSEIRNSIRRTHVVGKGDKRTEYFGHSTVVVSNGNEPDLLEAIETIANKGKDIFGSK